MKVINQVGADHRPELSSREALAFPRHGEKPSKKYKQTNDTVSIISVIICIGNHIKYGLKRNYMRKRIKG